MASRATAADCVFSLAVAVGRKITRTTKTTDIAMSTANSASSVSETTRSLASSQPLQVVSLLQRPASPIPVAEAKRLRDHDTDDECAEDQHDQRGRVVPAEEGSGDGARVLSRQNDDHQRQDDADTQPPEQPVPTTMRSRIGSVSVSSEASVVEGSGVAVGCDRS